MSNLREAGNEPCPCDNLQIGPADARGRRSIFIPETAWANEPMPRLPRGSGRGARPNSPGAAAATATGVAVIEQPGAAPGAANLNVCFLPGPQPRPLPGQPSTFLGQSTAGGPFGATTLAELGIVHSSDQLKTVPTSLNQATTPIEKPCDGWERTYETFVQSSFRKLLKDKVVQYPRGDNDTRGQKLKAAKAELEDEFSRKGGRKQQAQAEAARALEAGEVPFGITTEEVEQELANLAQKLAAFEDDNGKLVVLNNCRNTCGRNQECKLQCTLHWIRPTACTVSSAIRFGDDDLKAIPPTVTVYLDLWAELSFWANFTLACRCVALPEDEG